MYVSRFAGLGAPLTTAARLKPMILAQMDPSVFTSRAAQRVRNDLTAADTVTGQRLRAQRDVLRQIQTDDAPAPNVSASCQCKVNQLAQSAAQQGGPLDNATLSSLLQGCSADEGRFDSLAAQAGVRLDACKPFWKRRSTLIVGAGLVAVFVAWKVVR